MAPIVATSAVVPVIAGFIMGERPRPAVLGGIVVALFGVVLASRQPAHAPQADHRRSIILAVAAAGLLGLQLIFLQRAGVLDTAANLAFTLATLNSSLAIVAVLSSRFPPVTLGLAYLGLQERLTRPQLGDVAAALTGVLLIV
ncbi:MAG: hypothetical protein ACHP7K_06800, partial [Actinomycetales bacterium]